MRIRTAVRENAIPGMAAVSALYCKLPKHLIIYFYVELIRKIEFKADRESVFFAVRKMKTL